jgi:uncharacterized membrane protein
VGYIETSEGIHAVEWSGGSIIKLGDLPGIAFASVAYSINDAGQAAGYIQTSQAAEWSGGGAINLGLLPGATYGAALGINGAGQVVGFSFVQPPTPPPLPIHEPSTWAMTLAGFAGLAFAGYRQAKHAA